jgi:hypothetical protein
MAKMAASKMANQRLMKSSESNNNVKGGSINENIESVSKCIEIMK